jgi:protein-disulfide isomerase
LRWVIIGGVMVLILIAALIIGVNRTSASSGGSGAPGQAASPSASSAPSTSGDDDSGDSQAADSLARRKKHDPTAMGNRRAPVVMIEYADYRCPFCGIFVRKTLPTLKKQYIDTGKVRYERRDMTIYGDQSVQAAVAARAAGKQGKYWQFHDAVYDAAPKRGHPDLPRKKLIKFAKAAGVANMDQFKKDMTSKKLKDKVAKDTQEGQQLGATATPTFLINGKPVMGAQPTQVFEQTIDDALDKSGN